MRYMKPALVTLLFVGAAAQAQTAPPTPPARRAPAPLPAPGASAAPTPAPAAPPRAVTIDGLRGDYLMDLQELRGAMNLSAQLAPLARIDMDELLAGQRAAIDGARSAALAGTRAGMEGVRAAMEGTRAAMEGQRAMFDARAAASFNEFSDFRGLTPTFAGSTSYRTQAPASWAPQDAADSLYREARRALANDNYPIAALAFRKIRDQYPKSSYAPDSYYWEAFAMQRISDKDATPRKASLTGALELLEQQREKFPRASTRSDASALRTRIEGQLAQLGDQSAIASLASRAKNATSDGCPREQDDERIDALNALGQMDAEQSLPILKKVLARREPCTQRLRRQAVWLIASRKQPDAASILLNVAKTDPDKEVREQAVFWMSNVPTEEATSMLIELVKKGDDLDLRKRAIYSLSRSKSPRAAATIKEIALDPSADVDLRGDALNWYLTGPGRTDDAMSFLKDVYGRADDMRYKQRVLQIIASRRNDESRTFLVDLAQNPKESLEVRRTAIWSLQGSGVTAAQLDKIYESGLDIELRKQLIGVLSSLRDNGGIDKLLDIARNEKNVELRKQAITYLSRSKDPRALALMQEIINR